MLHFTCAAPFSFGQSKTTTTAILAASEYTKSTQDLRELELAAERLVVEMLEKAAEDLVERKVEEQVETQSEQMMVDAIMNEEEAAAIGGGETAVIVPKKEVKCRIHNSNYREGPWVCTCFESVGTKHVSTKAKRVVKKAENIKQKTCRIHGAQIYGSDYDSRPFKCTCFD